MTASRLIAFTVLGVLLLYVVSTIPRADRMRILRLAGVLLLMLAVAMVFATFVIMAAEGTWPWEWEWT